MANTIITPAIIAKEAALQLVNNLVFARLANKQFKNDFGVKVGDTISYRKPVRFTATDGATLSLQDVTETSGTISIDKRKHVGWAWNSKDLTLSIDEYVERYVKPACITLANQIDMDGQLLYKDVYNASGTAGGSVDFGAMLDTKQKMTEFSVMLNDRFAALTPAATNSLLLSLTANVFQPSLVEDIMREASVGRLSGLDLFESQNVITHTKGTATTITLASNPAEGASSVSLTAGGNGTLVKGDIITFAACNAVNPISKNDLGYAAQFVVTATTTVTTATSVPISPAMKATTAYQNVTALPTTGSNVVTLVGSHATNIAFQKNAFALVTVPIQAPEGVPWSETVEYQGVSIRLIKDFDITNDQEIVRLDVLYGWTATYPDLACRILGST
jgi:hypothetical protein